MTSIKKELELIRNASQDAKKRIGEILEKDNKLDIASMRTDGFTEDLYKLMKKMAEVSNPVLSKMGLDSEAIVQDISEFVKILEDNEHKMYFASVNIDAKYAKNKYTLFNLANWFERLELSIEKIEGFLETETEAKELETLFTKLDKTTLSAKEKEEIKEDFLKALNRLNS